MAHLLVREEFLSKMTQFRESTTFWILAPPVSIQEEFNLTTTFAM